MLVPCNQLSHIVIVEDGHNNFEASTLGTVSMEYNIVLRNTPIIFSKFNELG
jgi:hypothetical protein